MNRILLNSTCFKWFRLINWCFDIIFFILIGFIKINGEFKLSSIFISMCFRCLDVFLKLLLRCHSTIYTNKISRVKLNLNPFIVVVDLQFSSSFSSFFFSSQLLHLFYLLFIVYYHPLLFSLCVWVEYLFLSLWRNNDGELHRFMFDFF